MENNNTGYNQETNTSSTQNQTQPGQGAYQGQPYQSQPGANPYQGQQRPPQPGQQPYQNQQYPYQGQPYANANQARPNPNYAQGQQRPPYQGQPAPGGQPPYQNQPNPIQPANGLATASLVLGIIAVVMGWTGYAAIVAVACGLVGVILAVKAKKSGHKSGKLTAGLVLSIIGLILGAVVFVSCLACVGIAGCATALSY